MIKMIKLLSVGVASGGLAALDNSIKTKIEDGRINNGVIDKTNGFAEIEKHHNKGIPLNKFDNHTKEIAAISAVVLSIHALSSAFQALDDNDSIADIANTFILGGALSNVYDRVARGYVVDYLKIGKKRAIYNISDFMIIFGVLISCLNTLFKHKTD